MATNRASLPLFYRMVRPMRADGPTRRVSPETLAERQALFGLRGHRVVACPRFPVPYDSPTLQGVPVQDCTLCDVIDGGSGDTVILVPLAEVRVLGLLQDVDETECLMVDADVEWGAEPPTAPLFGGPGGPGGSGEEDVTGRCVGSS